MGLVMPTVIKKHIEYPTTDGKPMAETELHAQILTDSREIVVDWFSDDPWTYAWGNLLVYYQEGNPRKHLAPDIFVAKNVFKTPPRDHYLIWHEGKAPDLALEITSKTTAAEDLSEKMQIYRDVWKVREYLLFDPRSEYLKPPLQGFRRKGSKFVRIRLVDGRLPSEVLRLHLEMQGTQLRFFDPLTGTYQVTAREKLAQMEAARQQAEAERQRAETEIERLRRELEELRRQSP